MAVLLRLYMAQYVAILFANESKYKLLLVKIYFSSLTGYSSELRFSHYLEVSRDKSVFSR